VIKFSNPFKAKGIWVKGNLHSHTTFSDGMLTPQQLVYLYERNGYDFIAITDHGVIAPIDDLSKEDFLVLRGVELAVGSGELGDPFHIVAIGIDEQLPVKNIKRDTDPQEVIDLIKEHEGEAIIAHPYWSSLTLRDLESLRNYLGIEVFNTTCLVSIGKGLSTVHWDYLLTKKKQIYGFAVDDVHWHFDEHRPPDALGGWVMVRVQDLSPSAILKALREGLFYSSTGPVIESIDIKGDEIYVRCSPVKYINFIVDRYRGRRITARGSELLREAHYRIKGNELYIRIECIDSEGNIAWSNPIFLL